MQAHLQFAQSASLSKNCKRACIASAIMKEKLLKMPHTRQKKGQSAIKKHWGMAATKTQQSI